MVHLDMVLGHGTPFNLKNRPAMHSNRWKSLLLRPRGVIGGFSEPLSVPYVPVDHLPPLGGDTHRATARLRPTTTCHEDALVRKMPGISEVCPARVAF